MDHDVGIGDQRVDGVAVEDVALPVLGFGPAVRRRIERPTGHADDPLHLGVLLQRLDRRNADIARRPGDRDRQSHAAAFPHHQSGETFA